MLRVKSLRDLPTGFHEYQPPDVPEHLFCLMAEAIPAARKLGVKSVEMEETYKGVRAKLTIKVPAK